MPTKKSKKKVFVVDYPHQKTTKHWMKYLEENHILVTEPYFNALYAEWADVIWIEWLETPAVEAAKRSGTLENVLCQDAKVAEHGSYHTRKFSWRDKPIHMRGIDMDVYYGHFRAVNWTNVTSLSFICPHVRDLVDIPLPEKLPIHIFPLSVDIDAFKYRERDGKGHNIAWVNHNWTAKGLTLALIALHELMATTGEAWFLHVVENGKSNEFWYHDFIKHQVESLGLQDNVRFYGPVDSVDEFLDDKDFLWHTSYKEAFSLIIGEALAKGIPVVTMDWRDAGWVWDSKMIARTPQEFVTRTLAYPFSSSECRVIASKHSVEKEIKKLCEITGL